MSSDPDAAQTVLFVDDEPRVLRALRRLLRDDRWRVHTASSGAAAMALLHTRDVDVVVSDFRMPDMDGVGLLERVRDDHPAAVRVMLSGEIDDVHLARSTAVAHQWLTKPCEPERIVGMLERAGTLREMLEREEVRALIGGLGGLPTSPNLWSRLQQALADPDGTVDDVALIVAGDAGMSAKVLQLVNSAFMGLPRAVSSIREAIVYIGMETVRMLVVSVEVFRAFPLDPRIASLSIDALSAHGQACAQLVRSQLYDPIAREHAAAAAMLQDVGQLVHASCDPGGYAPVLEEAVESGRSLHDVERARFGFTHADVGAYLLTLWGLPPAIVAAVRRHHEPLGRLGHAEPGATSAVRISHLLVHTHNRRAGDPGDRSAPAAIDIELAEAVPPDVLERWTAGAVRGAAAEEVQCP